MLGYPPWRDGERERLSVILKANVDNIFGLNMKKQD